MRVSVALVLSLLVTGPAAASTGQVVDTDGKPVAGAKVCWLVGPNAEGICGETDEEGRYRLPESSLRSIRISAPGHFPRVVDGKPRRLPVRLAPASSFRARLLDAATGEGIEEGTLVVETQDGRQREFPTRSGWLTVSTFPLGEAIFSARAEGYGGGGTKKLVLLAGEQAEIVIRLDRAPRP